MYLLNLQAYMLKTFSLQSATASFYNKIHASSRHKFWKYLDI